MNIQNMKNGIGRKNGGKLLGTIVLLALFIFSQFPIHDEIDDTSAEMCNHYPPNESSYFQVDANERSGEIDLALTFWGIENDTDYYSIDQPHTLFCVIRNNNNVESANNVRANVTVSLDGDAVMEDSVNVDKIVPYQNEDQNEITVSFKQFLPIVEGTYMVEFEINHTEEFTSDPNPTNNYQVWYVLVENRVSISVGAITIIPEQEIYKIDSQIFISYVFTNHALTEVTFDAGFCITYAEGYEPLMEVINAATLGAKGQPDDHIALEYNFTFNKISNHTITISAHHDDNLNTDDTHAIEVVVERLKPPVPLIRSPVDNTPWGNSSVKYYTNEAILLDASESNIDENSTEVTYSWASDMEGWLSNGISVWVILETEGIHTITLTITDNYFTRSESILIKVTLQGIIFMNLNIVETRAQFTSEGEIETAIEETLEPGGNTPLDASLDIFRKVFFQGQGLVVNWINMSINYVDQLDLEGEEQTDVNTIKIYLYDNIGGKWTSLSHQGVNSKKGKVWANISVPSLSFRFGVFTNNKLLVARLEGTVFSYNPISGEKTKMVGQRIRIDRFTNIYTDENGKFTATELEDHTFTIDISQNGYQSISFRTLIKRGEVRKLEFRLTIKMGYLNGTVAEYKNLDNTLDNVTVNLIPNEGGVYVVEEEFYQALTDENGSFSFSGIPIGRYRILLTPMDSYIYGEINTVEVIFEDDLFETPGQDEDINHIGFVAFEKLNRGPKITAATVSPSTGKVGDMFTFSIEYSDPDGEAPKIKVLHLVSPHDEKREMFIDSNFLEYNMTVNYTKGIVFIKTWQATETGDLIFNFIFEDARGESAGVVEPLIIHIMEEIEVEPESFPTWGYVLIVMGAIIVGLLIFFLVGKLNREQFECQECGAKVDIDDYECEECGAELPDLEEEFEDGEEEDEEDEDIDYDSYSSIGGM